MEPTLLLPLVATEGDMAVATVDLEVEQTISLNFIMVLSFNFPIKVAIMPGAMEAHDTTEGIKGDCGGGKTFQETTFTNLS